MNIQSVMTPRLLAIADSVPFGAILADVGTDHGYIPIYLHKEHKIERALAMDLRQGPLSRAEENIERFGLNDYIKTRLSDGLCALSDGEVDTAVIAGMGGLLIAEILEKSPVKLDCYILQPMTATAELREYLANNGYMITDERLAKEDNKIYTIMTVKHGEMKVENPVYYQVGEKLLEHRDPLLPEFLDGLIHKYSQALSGLLRAERVDTKTKIEEYKTILETINALKEVCAKW